ncbi:MAG: hypothetical protein DRG78_17725 [Epsilonproteobacteria bacterium]|nr:MAG: hypothetical protein DRG78_17725 [Campylobacterota bacterium]
MFQIIAGKLNSGSVKVLLGIILIISIMSIGGNAGKLLEGFFTKIDFFVHFYKMPYNDIAIAVLMAFGFDDLLKHRRSNNRRNDI